MGGRPKQAFHQGIHTDGQEAHEKMFNIANYQRNANQNYNENKKIQNLWDAAKAVLRRKFIAIQAYLKEQEKSQINNLNLHLKELEKEEQTKPKVSRRK